MDKLTLRQLLLSLLLAGSCAHAGERAVFSTQADQRLLAVGKLTVPGYDRVDGERLYREENCTASLVAPSTILTAWHCLEHYRDLSRDPVFTLPLVPGQGAIVARRVADGGGMEADWALLRLARPVEDVEPLPVVAFPGAGSELLLAGYARDEGLCGGGEKLTWQAGCTVADISRQRVSTNCVTYKGASGGAVLSVDGVVGVISAGDSTAQTWFYPSGGFITRLRAFSH